MAELQNSSNVGRGGPFFRFPWAMLLIGLTGSGCASWRARATADQLASARRISLQGIEAEQSGNWTKAEECYAEALQVCPTDDRSRCRYAEALWRRGDHSGAIANMQEAVRLSNQSPEQVVQLGRMHFELNDNQTADQQSLRAIEHNKNLASAWVLRGDIARKEGRLEDALSDYLRARAMPECPADVTMAIADIYAEQGRPQRALATLQTLSDQYHPTHVPPELTARRGMAFRALGRNEQAVACFLRVCESNVAGPDQFFQLAEAQQAIGDYANARLSLQRALDKNPQHPAAQQMLARLGPFTDELSGVQRY